MEKNNSLLYAILGGVITCFICVGMVFIFPSNGSKNLSGSEKSLPEQPVEQRIEEEINLGDTCYSAWTKTGTGSWTCGQYSAQTGSPPSSATGTTWSGVETGSASNCTGTCTQACYRTTTYTRSVVACATTAPTATATTTTTTYSCYDKNNSCYLKTGLTSNCNGTTYFTTQSKCYEALGGNPTATATTATCSSYSMQTADRCSQEAQDDCAPYGYTGCTTKGSNGCYSYTCKSAPTTAPTATSPVCNTPCCIGGNTATDISACSAPMPAGNRTCGACPTPTAATCSSYSMQTADRCSQEAQDDCAPYGYTGCTTKGSNGCYSYTCKSAPTPTPTPTSPVCNTPCCIGGNTATDISACSAPMPAGNRTCGACPTPTPKVCTVPNTYWNGTDCISCPTGYKASTSITQCYIDVPAGSYLVGGTTQILACPANTYSTGGTYYLKGGNASLTSCTACPNSGKSPIGSKSSDDCKAATGKCTVTASTSAQKVSPHIEGKCESIKGYADTFTVTVSVSGDGCNKGTLTMSSSGAARTGSTESFSVSDGQTFHILYKPTTCCQTATVTATVAYTDSTGKKATTSGSTSVISTGTAWNRVATDACRTAAEYNSHYHSDKAADDANADEYWIAKDNKICATGGRQVDIYKRGGCGGGGGYNPTPTPVPGSTPTPTPAPGTTPTPTPFAIPYCYVDSDGAYYWTKTPQASWKKVDGITKEENCKPDENPACYEDSNKNYVWGKYAKMDGYKLIDSIKDESTCKKPEDCACYKNASGVYAWATEKPEECFEQDKCWISITSPIDPSKTTCPYDTKDKCETAMGYTKVDSIKTPTECTAPEDPACYVHGSEFVWGKFAKNTGYIKLDDITNEDDCKLPEDDACYEDIDGNYVWGKYGDDPTYTIVPSVTELSQCTKDVPVQPLASNVSRLVYVFMAILMACGIGFIYYSSVIKKSNQ